jgi:hypothetical protein
VLTHCLPITRSGGSQNVLKPGMIVVNHVSVGRRHSPSCPSSFVVLKSRGMTFLNS